MLLLKLRLYWLLRRYKLKAEILPIQSVGVIGDERCYLPVVILYGPFPGWPILAQISAKITNNFPIGRVTYQVELEKYPVKYKKS